MATTTATTTTTTTKSYTQQQRQSERHLHDLRRQHMSTQPDPVKDRIMNRNDEKSPRHVKNKLYMQEMERMETGATGVSGVSGVTGASGYSGYDDDYDNDDGSFLSYDSVPESQQEEPSSYQPSSSSSSRRRKMTKKLRAVVPSSSEAAKVMVRQTKAIFKRKEDSVPIHISSGDNNASLRRRLSRGDSSEQHQQQQQQQQQQKQIIQVHHLQQQQKEIIPMEEQYHAPPQPLSTMSNNPDGSTSVAPSYYTHHTNNTSSSSFYHGPPPNPFTIPPGTKLSPRADIWLLLVLACAISVGSLADISSPSSYSMFGSFSSSSGGGGGVGTERSTNEQLSLVLSSLSFLITTFVAIGYRYGPTRFHLTRGKCEWYTALCLLVLVVCNTSIMMTSSKQGDGSGGGSIDYIAVSANSIWNTNLFYSQWIIFFGSGYIVGDLLTTENHFGTLSREYVPTNHIARTWFVFLLSSISMGGVSSSLVNGSTCTGTLLHHTPLCSNALGAAVIGFLNVMLSLLALGLHRLQVLGGDRMHYYFNVHSIPMKWFDGHHRCQRNCRRIGSLLAVLGWSMSCVSVGIVSAPGGPGTEANSIFVTTWMVFGLSFLLCKKYVEEYLGLSPVYGTFSSSSSGVGGGGVYYSQSQQHQYDAHSAPTKAYQRAHQGGRGRNGGGSNINSNNKNHPRQSMYANDGSTRSGRTTVMTGMDECSQDEDYPCEDEEDMVDPFDGMEEGPSDDLSRGDDDDDEYTEGDEDDLHASDDSPFITTSDNVTAVSSLGESRYTMDPAGVKAGHSHYGGQDAGCMHGQQYYQQQQQGGGGGSVRHPQEAPQQVHGNGGMDAFGAKPPKQRSFHAATANNLYPQNRAWSQDVDSVGDSTRGTDQTPMTNPSFSRRGSLNSYASGIPLSPLREESQEGSRTSSSKSSRSSSRKKGRGPPPPQGHQYQQQQQQPTNRTYMKKSSESSNSLSLPLTEDDGLASRGPATVDQSRQSRSGSAQPRPRLDDHIQANANGGGSDFDILLSESSTVVTELTSEGFDPQQTPRGHHSPPQGFPSSNPLYNTHNGGGGGYGDIASPVDELVASALAHARRSRNQHGGNNDSGTAEIFTDEESAAGNNHHPHHYNAYQGGGVSSGTNSSSDNDRRERRQNPQNKKKGGSGKKNKSKKSPEQQQKHFDSNQSTSTSKSGRGYKNKRMSIQSNFSELGKELMDEDLGDFVC